jgi:hypothetical protein
VRGALLELALALAVLFAPLFFQFLVGCGYWVATQYLRLKIWRRDRAAARKGLV